MDCWAAAGAERMRVQNRMAAVVDRELRQEVEKRVVSQQSSSQREKARLDEGTDSIQLLEDELDRAAKPQELPKLCVVVGA